MTKDKPKKIDKSQKLLEASRLGQLQQLELLLSQFHQLKSKKKTNPLASLRRSVSPNNIRDPVTGFTCLHHASLNGHAQCVRLILNYGARLNAVDYKGSSALHLAAWAGNLEIVKILLDHHAQPTYKIAGGSSQNTSPSWSPGTSSCSPSEASRKEEKDKLLDINLCNNDNQTALSLAAQFGHNAVVAELLLHGANVHIRNNRLESPLELACLNGRLETVNLLLKSSSILVAELRKASSSVLLPNPLFFEEPYHRAAEESHVSVRKQSAAWSSLLGRAGSRRDSSDSSSPSNQRSPVLQRFTPASLSMRQSSLAGQKENSPEFKEKAARRRATLSISGPLPANFNLLDAHHQQLQQQHLLPAERATVEKLLEHSPLHYATRKNHTNVVHLLLYQYQANLLQTSSLGSVLHEVALSCNQGRHGDMIRLLFNYIGSQHCGGAENRIQLLNRLLSLKNAAGRSVFEVLNEINNRTSQDIKRMIYQFSEQQLAASNAQFSQSNKDSLFSSQQQITARIPSQMQQFSDMQQINSFVTMKRPPKQAKQASYNNNSTTSNNNHQSGCFNPNQAPQHQLPLGTQTIGRRRSGTNSRVMDGYPDWSQSGESNSIGMQPRVSGQSMNGYQPQLLPQITRSVSNLTQPHQRQAEFYQNNPNWQNQIQQQQQQMFLMQQQHFKNPNLGSILLESNQFENPQGPSDNLVDSLYDNPSPFENVEPNNSVRRHHLNQLVRSQTDCSHLMGRFFGDQISSLGACGLNQHHQSSRVREDERKAINRQYHVYEREFYPPRLLPAAGPHQLAQMGSNHSAEQLLERNKPLSRQLVGVVPLMNKNIQQEIPNLQCSTTRNQPERCDVDRLSLNLSQTNQTQANNLQQHQMDRFLPRQAEMQNFNRCSSVDQQQAANLERINSNQLHSVHMANSISLESHLSEPHLFESTRQALMNDFDKLIGQELLNRNHQQIIEGTLRSQQPQARAEGQLMGSQSILTGVMLDMDSHGERLTVSGTCVTMPPQYGRSLIEAPHRKISNSSSPSADSNAISPISVTSHGTQTSATDLTSGDSLSRTLKNPASQSKEKDEEPEEKSRPANNKPVARQRESKKSAKEPILVSSSHPVIYDLPNLTNSNNVLPSKQPPDGQSNKRASGGRVHKLTSQFSTGSTNCSKSSLTEPPMVKPPPPPQSDAPAGRVEMFGSPLQIVATNGPSPETNQPGSLSSNCSTICSSSAGTTGGGSSSSNIEVGLLKMSSIKSTSSSNDSSRRYRFKLAATSGDPDSGVCTSNSPASTSHDSEAICSFVNNSKDVNPKEELVVFDEKRRMSTGGPPSPKTAQLCIEEALMPLAQRSLVETNNRTTSPMSSFCASTTTTTTKTAPALSSVIDDWLIDSVCKAASKDDGSTTKEADYENCLALQQQLASNGLTNEAEEDDGDYANVSPEASGKSPSTSSCSSTSSGEDESLVMMKGQNKAEEPEMSQRREILLKVMIDANERNSQGEEVFYIDRSELKKLANSSTGKTMENASTLTEEELCAGIDENSGYIKFMLRKRQQTGESTQRNVQPNEEQNQGKMNDCQGKLPVVQMLTRRHSEMISQPEARDELNTGISNSSSQGRICTPEVLTNPLECEQIAELQEVRHEPIRLLRLWFFSNLAGLIDYLPNFIQNGLDDLKFLNHSRIINDEILKAIGIEDETHRLLIIDNITSKLPAVDFGLLFASDIKRKEMPDASLMFELLHLGSIFDSSTKADKLINNVDIESLKERYSHLPTGYKSRLTEAIDFLSDEINSLNELNDAASAIQKQPPMENVIEAINDDVEMDVAQDSTNSPPASSSSSKESIKSIVLLKKPQTTATDCSQLERVNGDKPGGVLVSKSELNLGAKARTEDTNKQPELLDASKTKEEDALVTRQVSNNFNFRNAHSTVSETAKRLEAAANSSLRTAPSPPQRPVAAVRRFATINDKLANRQNEPRKTQTTEVDNPNQVKPPVSITRNVSGLKTVCWPPKAQVEKSSPSGRIEDKEINGKESIRIIESKQAPTLPPPPSSATIRKFNVDRKSSYHRLIEEAQQQNTTNKIVREYQQQVQTKAVGPKPPPPIKPAKLVAARLTNKM